MIPLRDVIPSRTTPYITIAIIIVNALAWLLEVSMPSRQLNEFLFVYGVVPASFTAPTLITSMFLHGSWMHVIGNMWYLWIFGDNVEDRLGHGRFIAFYLMCGIAAALGQVFVDPTSTLPTIAREYSLEVSRAIRAGVTTVEFVNDGKQEHDLQIVRLDDGTSASRVAERMEGDTAAMNGARFVGGVSGVGPGRRAWTQVRLSAGRYALFCFVPDERDGK